MLHLHHPVLILAERPGTVLTAQVGGAPLRMQVIGTSPAETGSELNLAIVDEAAFAAALARGETLSVALPRSRETARTSPRGVRAAYSAVLGCRS